MSSTEGRAQAQTCSSCGSRVDTAGQEPFAKISCPKCGETLRVERAFEHFKIVEPLGTGGMGAVYKAMDTRLNRLVALKLLRKDIGGDVDYSTKLRDEARITASINHPNVIKVFSFGSDSGQFYVVMELVEGGSLDDLMETEKRVPEAQALEVGLQVARGLEAALRAGLIHRDIKPGNILFGDSNTAKIVDFGLALIAQQQAGSDGELWGTPYYIAPERLAAEPEDFRSDIYSLGATLYHAISGRPMFEQQTQSATELKQLKSAAPGLKQVAPHVSAEGAEVIGQMLQLDPAARQGSYKELIAQLRAAHGIVTAREEERKSAPRTPWAIIAIVSALLLVAVIAGAVWFKKNRSGKLSVAQVLQVLPPAIRLVDTAPLQRELEEARREIVAGHYEAASKILDPLKTKAADVGPLLGWIQLHRGLVLLLSEHPVEAAQVFAEMKTAPASPAPDDAGLAAFFAEAGQQLAASEPVAATTAKARYSDSPKNFALLLFGLKDFAQTQSAEGAALLEAFVRSQPQPADSWINDFKPIAENYLADYRLLATWKTARGQAHSAAELTVSLASLRQLEQKIAAHPALAAAAKNEETALGEEIAKLAADQQTAEEDRLMATESPVWRATLEAARKNLALYKFAEAAAQLDRVRLTSRGLRAERDLQFRKAQWLAKWKAKLIADLNLRGFPGPVTDINGSKYPAAIHKAVDVSMELKLQYGTMPMDWTRLPPKMLLTMSTYFLAPPGADVADRQWLCAIFAEQTAQPEAARALAAQAAQAKPAYAELVPMFFP